MYKIFIIILLWGCTLFAYNELSVTAPGEHGATKPGYIERVLLVVQPHCGYVEQSLYIYYTDRNQYPDDYLLEICHSFNLPEQSVVNDMWLWIGDSVMQAKMFEVKEAQSIYDSIVGDRMDPAFLKKKNQQYTLSVYPFNSGEYRKVKINFIHPVNWIGNQCIVSLPIIMLNAAANSELPLHVFFKKDTNAWVNPEFKDHPEWKPEDYIDSVGCEYQYYEIDNIKNLSSLEMIYEQVFNSEGFFYEGIRKNDDSSFFHLCLNPKDFFQVYKDTVSTDYFVAVDYSGRYEINPLEDLDMIGSALEKLIKPGRRIKYAFSALGQTYTSPEWVEKKDIPDLINNLKSSPAVHDLLELKSNKASLIYCDEKAPLLWHASGIEDYAQVQFKDSLIQALRERKDEKILAAYSHGERCLPFYIQLEIYNELDEFFEEGGWFLTYYDVNRNPDDTIWNHINGLDDPGKSYSGCELFPVEGGNLNGFNGSVYAHSIFTLSYDDPNVTVEMETEYGEPVVISKKIKNGLMVVSGIMCHKDGDGIKAELGIPLLGLNQYHSSSDNYQTQFFHLLDVIHDSYQEEKFGKVMLLSNYDSLLHSSDAVSLADDYLKKFNDDYPCFVGVSLLKNSYYPIPVYQGVNRAYYGVSYFLKSLSDRSRGLYVDTRDYSLDFLCELIEGEGPVSFLSFTPSIQNSITSENYEIRDLWDNWQSKGRPLYLAGKIKNVDSLKLNLSVDIESFGKKEILLSLPIDNGNEKRGLIIESILAYEKIKELFLEQSDNKEFIIEYSKQYNLLTDYTALLALEPDDSNSFMIDPLDEDGFLPTDIKENLLDKDSLLLETFPNPFTDRISIRIKILKPVTVSLQIFNLFGQKVIELANQEKTSNCREFVWDGKNQWGGKSASGVYLVSLEITDEQGMRQNLIKKILLIK